MISDVLVVGIVLISIVSGYRKGFIKAVFRIFSKIASLVLAIKFYKPLAHIIANRAFFSEFTARISSKITRMLSGASIASDDDLAGEILDSMHIPNTIKESVITDLPYDVNSMDKSQIIEVIASKLGTAMLYIFCVVAIFLVTRLVFLIMRNILDKIFYLPLLKQLNKVAGLLFGSVEGFLAAYIVMSIAALINSEVILSNIECSLIAKHLYYNNLLLLFM
ncbi:MAG: CvpA family protein [Clostridiales bacterium]|nr:CvpA family protein [Clostridiales bacterium]